jgi:hypothetical protein
MRSVELRVLQSWSSDDARRKSLVITDTSIHDLHENRALGLPPRDISDGMIEHKADHNSRTKNNPYHAPAHQRTLTIHTWAGKVCIAPKPGFSKELT